MEQLNCKNIILCFPYKGVGGVSLLFLRLSNHLQQITRKNIILIDYKDGYMSRHNQNKNVSILEYSDDAKTEIPSDSLVLLQSMTPWSIFPNINFRADTKLFFWNCHPFNLVPLLPGLRNWIAQYPKLVWLSHKTLLISYNLTLKKFYKLLVNQQSIAFMDADNLKMTEFILGQHKPHAEFLPIPVEVPQINSFSSRSKTSQKKFTCGWVGRVADFKHTILKRTIIELKKYAGTHKQPIHFILVGDGDYIDQIKPELVSTDYFSYEHIKEVSPQELDQFILKNIDLLFSMGTSALESAKLGIPSVLLDFSYGPVPETYGFKFIFESQHYSLGRVITSELCDQKNSIDRIIRNTLANPAEISDKCYQYCLSKHSIESTTNNLLNRLKFSNLTYGQLTKTGVVNKSFIYKFFKALKTILLQRRPA